MSLELSKARLDLLKGKSLGMKVGNVYPMCDEGDYIDGRFNGLCVDVDKDSLITILGRGRERNSKRILTYLMPLNMIHKFKFGDELYLFDGFNFEDVILEEIKYKDPNYQKFNNQMEAAGL